ncbi:MAG: YraN family protein [Acidiferrobacterales bacterium]
MPAKHLQHGRLAEERARRYLRKQGLKLVVRNYRSPYGEIDLIMRERETLVFVEVRYRRHQAFGLPAETVDWRKQNKLRATAEHFLQNKKNLRDCPCRFDVMTISGDHKNGTIDWYPDAF